jgi:hypothetical protein
MISTERKRWIIARWRNLSSEIHPGKEWPSVAADFAREADKLEAELAADTGENDDCRRD